ncbi:MAG: hypothetical protein ABI168_00815 [Ginsengibacter sp.]
MLLKSFFSAVFILSFLLASAQDSTMNKNKTITTTHKHRNITSTHPKKKHIYRDTRLGSSSPMYNTYKKNDKGAGAITTNPNKGGGGTIPVIVVENGKDSVYKR